MKNWRKYNKSLVQRGSLDLYIDPELEKCSEPEASCEVGRPQLHSDVIIALALTLQAVYQLPLRQTQGLLASVFHLAGLRLPVPDYSTLSRRRASMLGAVWAKPGDTIAIDSTGLQIKGPGSWLTTVHGHQRRSWRKVHLGVDTATGEVVAALCTGVGSPDCRQLPKLLNQAKPRPKTKVMVDGAYDRRCCYDAAGQHGLRLVAPPRHDAVIHPGDPSLRKRNKAIKRIRKVGLKRWKKETHYHRRSIIESTMWRLKSAFGTRLRSRSVPNQDQETLLRLQILNRWPTPNALAFRKN
jgi:hypothetical protein